MSRQGAVVAGFNYAGFTTDRTALFEIKRDYLAQGYSEVVFAESKEGWHYYTKHPQINP